MFTNISVHELMNMNMNIQCSLTDPSEHRTLQFMTIFVKNDEIDSGDSRATRQARTSAKTERSCILAEIARAATLSLLQLNDQDLLPQPLPPFGAVCMINA